jgi:Protein of unknown function (DUF2884)
MKWIMVSVLCLSAACAQAKEACDMELEGGLRITKDALEFTQGDAAQYKILKDHTLWSKGRQVKLNDQQQMLVTQYATSIRALVPEVRQLSLEGVDLAAQAMNLVFQEFLEPGSATTQKIATEFTLLRADIEQGFAAGKPININQQGLSDGDFLGSGFEQRISNIVEASGKEISWDLIKSVVSAVFSGDEKSSNFEARMNKFGEKMEREMKLRSQKLEVQAHSVCRSVAALDTKEEALKVSIKEISQFNLIKMKPAAQLSATKSL